MCASQVSGRSCVERCFALWHVQHTWHPLVKRVLVLPAQALSARTPPESSVLAEHLRAMGGAHKDCHLQVAFAEQAIEICIEIIAMHDAPHRMLPSKAAICRCS